MGIVETFFEDLKKNINETLKEMIREVIAEGTTDKWMKVDELSKYWGVSKDWIYRNSDRIPHTKEGGLFFLRSEADAWRKGDLKRLEIEKMGKVSIKNYKSDNFRVGR